LNEQTGPTDLFSTLFATSAYNEISMNAIISSAIDLDNQGVARIGKTRIKVLHLVMAMKSWALDANGLQHNYPELSLAEIHAALAYYYENQEAFDQEISNSLKDSAALEVEVSDKQLRQALVDSKFGRHV
jgi:uncharacterized protein (DUF433 family)